MMAGIAISAIGAISCILAGAAGGFAATLLSRKSKAKALRKKTLETFSRDEATVFELRRNIGLRYAQLLTRQLYTGATSPLSPSVRLKRANQTKLGAKFRESALKAGCGKDISTAGFCEAALRLALAGALAGGIAGVMLSNILAVLLAVVGGVIGWSLPLRGLDEARKERATDARQHLSEMLEVVALGLRSGLTFDRSFALYGQYFDSDFAKSCALAYRTWSIGFELRDESLRALSDAYDCDQLARIVESVIRGLRFGTTLTSNIEESAAQARAAYQTSLAERVARAPVKMMLPTGTLILPAMLLLVMGPILLDLAGGF